MPNQSRSPQLPHALHIVPGQKHKRAITERLLFVRSHALMHKQFRPQLVKLYCCERRFFFCNSLMKKKAGFGFVRCVEPCHLFQSKRLLYSYSGSRWGADSNWMRPYDVIIIIVAGGTATWRDIKHTEILKFLKLLIIIKKKTKKNCRLIAAAYSVQEYKYVWGRCPDVLPQRESRQFAILKFEMLPYNV